MHRKTTEAHKHLCKLDDSADPCKIDSAFACLTLPQVKHFLLSFLAEDKYTVSGYFDYFKANTKLQLHLLNPDQ